MRNLNYSLLQDPSGRSGVRAGRKPGSLNIEFDYTRLLPKVDKLNEPIYLQIDGVGYPLRGSPGPIGHNDEADPDIKIGKKLRETYERYVDLVKYARGLDYPVAADNLEHWLGGSGVDREIDWKWLRHFSLVKDAEKANQSRFQSKIASLAATLNPGEEKSFQDYFVSSISVNPITSPTNVELFYACGISSLYSRGKFYVNRDLKFPEVKTRGTVQHHWWDRYDFHAGLAAWVPGQGWFNDADALKIENAKLARRFGMFSFWHQTASGTLGMSRLRTDKTTWEKPVEGIVVDGDVGDWKRHPSLYDAHGGLIPGIVLPG